MLLGNRGGETFVKSGTDFPITSSIGFLSTPWGRRLPSPCFCQQGSRRRPRAVSGSPAHPEVTQNREMPDYFLKLYFYGPFYTKSPTNKAYASVDTYTVMACGDVLDSNGRVVHGKCVDDKITDEVFGTIRYPNEAREEILVKNAIIKLANELARSVKFQTFQLPVAKMEGGNVVIEDRQGALVPGQAVTVFKKLDRTGGIDEDVYVPILQAAVVMKNGASAVATKVLPLSPKAPEPSAGDVVFMESAAAAGADSMKALTMCGNGPVVEGGQCPGRIGEALRIFDSQQVKYPFYDSKGFPEDIGQYNDPGFGFKRKMHIPEIKSNYCVEPVVKVAGREKRRVRSSRATSCPSWRV